MKRWIAPTAFAVSLFLPLASPGQATQSTAYQRAHLSVFGVGSYAKTEYGPVRTGYGFSAGADLGFTVPGLHHLEPGIEGRYSYARSTSVSESVPSVGVRLTWHAGALHPYGDLLIGPGTIKFLDPALTSPGYTQNNSKVWTYGGGIDYDVTRSFAIRGEIQRESWKLSATDPAFYPLHVGVGVRYQFHFKNRFGPE